jgi:hypothetical protein
MLNYIYGKPVVCGLYLSLVTLDAKMWSESLKGEGNWSNFVLKTLMAGQFPEKFPLRVMAGGMEGGWFFTDHERWKVAPK